MNTSASSSSSSLDSESLASSSISSRSSSSSSSFSNLSPEEFQALLDERKLERRQLAEQKRLEDLQRIWGEPSIPSDLSGLMTAPESEEIWEQVLEFIDDPQDLMNLYRIHSTFRGLMDKEDPKYWEKSRIRDILFPLVIRNVEAFLAEEKKSTLYDYQLAPYLALRGVSRSLRKAVDQFILDNLEKGVNGHRVKDGKDKERVSASFYNYFYPDERDQRRMVEMIEMKKNFPKTNFFLKSVSLSVNQVEDDYDEEEYDEEEEDNYEVRKLANYLDDITNFLKAIGDEMLLFKCTIDAFSHHYYEENLIFFCQVYDALVQWAELMPNLRWLDIRFATHGSEYAGWDEPHKQSGYEVEESLHDYPAFPQIPNLEKFSFGMYDYFIPMAHLCEQIIDRNSQVKAVAIEDTENQIVRRLSDFIFNSLDLTSFEMNAVGSGYEYEVQFGDFFSMSTILPHVDWDWPLCRLHLSVDMKDTSVNDLFEDLEKFQTLKRLSLQLYLVEIGCDEEIRSLRLPSLQEFQCMVRSPTLNLQQKTTGITEIDGDEEQEMETDQDEEEEEPEDHNNITFFFSFQFLLKSKNLKSLELVILPEVFKEFEHLRGYLEKKDYSGMVDIWNPEIGIKDSNIWNAFPKLKFLKIEGKYLDCEWLINSNEYGRCDRD